MVEGKEYHAVDMEFPTACGFTGKVAGYKKLPRMGDCLQYKAQR